jgi:S-DNA-T family DNA segregation ATPase FtsK/SpoIIIE
MLSSIFKRLASPTRNTRVRRVNAPMRTRVLREAAWLLSLTTAVYLLMTLATHTLNDPGWSRTGHNEVASNLGGSFGAWLADLLYYLFGYSAGWWMVLAVLGVVWSWQRMCALPDEEPPHPHGVLILTGFLLTLLSSASLEAMRFHTLATGLPLRAGGTLGQGLEGLLRAGLGFDGATLILVASLAIGLSLFSGLSWFRVCEQLGTRLERLGQYIILRWQDRQDRRAGLEAGNRRDAAVNLERVRMTRDPVLKIETPMPAIAALARPERERQSPLFRDTPDNQLPPLHLLDEPGQNSVAIDEASLTATSRLIERKLDEFGVDVKVLAAYPGPVVTRYEIEPASGVKGSQITNLSKDLARSLSVISIRVVETIPSKSCMALEIPNTQRQTVRLAEILGAKVYHDMGSPLTIALGKDIGGTPIVADLAKMPHLLVAGTTGSGKSVAINAMILSLLYKASPRDVRLIMVDPKMLELSSYEGIPHLLAPVVTDMRLAGTALNWCVTEMDRRYKLMSTMAVRNIAGLNHKIAEAEKAGTPLTNPFSLTPETPERLTHLPYLVVIIDELADLMMVSGKKVEELIARLAQKARASGIHLVLATQRPSVDVITGLIKANIPTRIAFQVSSRIDSRTILDQQGAESLLGMGDMLYLPPGHGVPTRVHGAFVSDDEVHRVTAFLRELAPPNYDESVLYQAEDSEGNEAEAGNAESDPLYDEAVAIVMRTRRASISAVQRHLRIGYNRAARLIEAMEAAGIVSPMQTNGNREVIGPRHDHE